MNEAVRKLAEVANSTAPHYREAPNNIEAEQALLGAILVNNDAFYRVSDFLKPVHLFEPLHRKIYEVAGDIIRMGKTANPVTIKTFLPGDEKVGDLTVAQYLARLAAEAVTIINAEDYGRAIYDLALRRALITIGEDMVNIAFDAPLDMPPQNQIEDAERRLFELAETGRYDGGFQSFNDAVALAIDMAGAAYQRDGGLSGISTGIHSLDAKMGGLQHSDLIILAGRPGMGKTSLATNIAFNIAQAFQPGEVQPDGSQKTANAASSASTRSKCRPSSSPPVSFPSRRKSLVQDPPRRDQRGRLRKARRLLADDAEDPALYRPDRRHLDRTARGTRASPEAPARARRSGGRLRPADDGLEEGGREPRSGNHGNHHRPEGSGQGAAGSDHRALPAVTPSGKPRGQAPAAFRPARIGLDRAGRRRRALRVPRRILCEEHGAAPLAGRSRRRLQVGGVSPLGREDEQGEGHGGRDHCQAASRPDRHGDHGVPGGIYRFTDLADGSYQQYSHE
jgi:hypothetical protein